MVYIKVNSKLMNMSRMSYVTDLSSSQLEQFVDRGLVWAMKALKSLSPEFSSNYKKINLACELDNLSIDDDIAKLIISALEDVDLTKRGSKTYIRNICSLCGLSSSTARSVIKAIS